MAKDLKSPAPLPTTISRETFQHSRKLEDGTFELEVPIFSADKPEELDAWLPVWGFASRDEALVSFINREVSKSAVAPHRSDIKDARAKSEKALTEALEAANAETRVSYWNGPRSSDGLSQRERNAIAGNVANVLKTNPEAEEMLRKLGIIK